MRLQYFIWCSTWKVHGNTFPPSENTLSLRENLMLKNIAVNFLLLLLAKENNKFLHNNSIKFCSLFCQMILIRFFHQLNLFFVLVLLQCFLKHQLSRIVFRVLAFSTEISTLFQRIWAYFRQAKQNSKRCLSKALRRKGENLIWIK